MWFQFTLPCRERLTLMGGLASGSSFQFTLPCRERPHNQPEKEDTPCFNSRSRVGSDGTFWGWADWGMGFNSRSRVGSDPMLVTPSGIVMVSIHAPV